MSPASLYIRRQTRSGCEFAGISSPRDLGRPSPGQQQRLLPQLRVPVTLPDSTPTLCQTPPSFISQKRARSPTLDFATSLTPPAASPTVDFERSLTPPPAKKRKRGAGNPSHRRCRTTTNAGAHRRRKVARRDKNMGGHSSSPAQQAMMLDLSTPVITNFRYSSLPVQVNGYGGIHLGSKASMFPHGNLQEMLSHGYRLLEWDGVKPMPLVDVEDRVFAVFAGRMEDASYLRACQELYATLEQIGAQEGLPDSCFGHQRGQYPSWDSGVSHGPGSVTITNTGPAPFKAMLNELLDSKSVRRVLGFCDGAFNRWAPHLYEKYRRTLDKTVSHPQFAQIRRISRKSVFACHSLNAGSRVITVPHRDSCNLGHGWCAIVALGTFNPNVSGHLVLHEPRLVIEFPSGSAALIPSAAITHSNVGLSVGDKRASITFYSAGGLFRFVDNDFRLQGSINDSQTLEDARKSAETICFSTLRELRERF